MNPSLTAGGADVAHVLLFAVLLLVPRLVQILRIPAAVTSFALGAAAGPWLGLFPGDTTVALLATLGIVSIFLLAGLDADLGILRSDARRLTQHLVIRVALIVAAAVVLASAFDLGARAAVVASLALFTPSGGFILASLPGMGLFADEVKVIRVRVLATELLCLALLLLAAQPATWTGLGLSVGGIALMIGILPLVIRALSSVVVPHAPGSEFAFVVLLAVVCAVVTRELGVHFLVGSFVVGLSARRLRERVPAESSHRLLHAVEAFSSVFAPFYFFRAGLSLRAEDFSGEALLLGAVLVVVVGGVRIGSMLEHSLWTRMEGMAAALRKAVPMMPTLVFSLVLADLLRDTFAAPEPLVGAIVVYGILNTVLPSLIVRHLPVPEYGTQKLPPWLGSGK